MLRRRSWLTLLLVCPPTNISQHAPSSSDVFWPMIAMAFGGTRSVSRCFSRLSGGAQHGRRQGASCLHRRPRWSSPLESTLMLLLLALLQPASEPSRWLIMIAAHVGNITILFPEHSHWMVPCGDHLLAHTRRTQKHMRKRMHTYTHKRDREDLHQKD